MIEILLLLLLFQTKKLRHREGKVTRLMADWDLNPLSKALEFLT